MNANKPKKASVKTSKRDKASNYKVEELAFRQGFYCAVASLKRMHDIGVEEELLKCYGKVDLNGIDEYDAQIIRKLK